MSYIETFIYVMSFVRLKLMIGQLVVQLRKNTRYLQPLNLSSVNLEVLNLTFTVCLVCFIFFHINVKQLMTKVSLLAVNN